MSCCLLLAAVATVGVAAPNRIVVVPASGRAALERLAQSGVIEYGRTERFVFAAPASTLGPLSSVELLMNPDRATYIVCDAHAKTELPGRILWRDGNTRLMQLSEAEAAAAARLGAALQRLPDEPHPIRLAPDRSYPLSTEADTLIQRLVTCVSADSIRKQIQRLQDFRTRYSLTESCRAAEQYVFDYFTSLGMDSVQLDTFQWNGVTMRNVVGTIVGIRNPEKIAIICGHMDSYSEDTLNFAPGAEDNASGTAMAIEAARVLAGVELDQTVKFIAFTGEEQWMVGSYHYAAEMRSIDADITGVLNFDMIAWPGGELDVSIYCDSASYGLALMEGRVADLYTTLDHEVVVALYGDELPFQIYGYQATTGGERGGEYPYYHTTGDTLGNLSMPLAAEVAKMGIAGLVTLAMAPSAPDSFRLWDAGTGGTLEATWHENAEPDLAGFRLYWGTASGVYTDSLVVGRVSRQRIGGLVDGTRYYVTIIALDSAGHQSGPSPEQSEVPGVRPLAPRGVSALPSNFGMTLAWYHNSELDLAGYNVYRSTVSGSGHSRVNGALLTDTTFRDSGLMSDTMYYYVVIAVDTSAKESPPSTEVRGKPITLDHGILLVDETHDGTGQRGSPNDAQQDAFYHALLRWTRYGDWDVAADGVPLAGDVGPYSTLVWHADDYSQQRIHPAVPGLINYLRCGGRLWLVGWKPILGLIGSGSYPFTFSAGQMPYDELHLAGAGNCVERNFVGATGRSGYPDVSIDSTKLFASFEGRLPYVDVLYPLDADTVLAFSAALGDSFQGKPVGIRWLAGPGKAVCFGFPLYYAVESEARAVALKVLTDLGEPYGLAEGTESQVEMAKALPTVARSILFLPDSPGQRVTVSPILLDVSGRKVMSLRPGANDVGALSPGVYFVRPASSVTKVIVTR